MMPESYRALGWTGVVLVVALVILSSGDPAPPGLMPFTGVTPPTALAAQAASASTMIDPLALQLLKGMSDSLKRATSFTFTATTTRDEVAITGQALEFYSHSSVSVTRPNKLLVRVQGDVVDGSLWCNGQTLTLLDAPTKFYARMSAPATIDGVLDVLENKFHDPLPVASFLYADPYARLTKGLKTAFVVGEGTVGGVRNHHLAFTEAQADWQIWIQDTPQPVPTRLTVIYKNIPRVGSLRVSTDLTNWNLQAQVPASAYLFVAPAGAKQVPLKPR